MSKRRGLEAGDVRRESRPDGQGAGPGTIPGVGGVVHDENVGVQ